VEEGRVWTIRGQFFIRGQYFPCWAVIPYCGVDIFIIEMKYILVGQVSCVDRSLSLGFLSFVVWEQFYCYLGG